MVMRKFLLSFILIFFVGCGSVPGTGNGESNVTRGSDRQQAAEPVPKEGEGVITAGDNQQVLEGTSVLLHASNLDKEKHFSRYVWKEGEKIIAQTRECRLERLGEGRHTIILEAVAEDGEVFTDSVTVVVKKPVPNNSMPTARDLHFTTPEDTVFHGALQGSDADGDALRYLLVALPEHGVLSGSAAHLHYTPDSDFNGEDRFLFKTNDGKIDSDIATVTISIEPRNDLPVADNLQLAVDEEASLDFSLHASDKESPQLTYRVVTAPAHGRLEGTPPNLTYRPDQGFVGTDTMRFMANDGEADSNIATVTIRVNDINIPPVVDPMALQTQEDMPLHATLSGRDLDGNTLHYRILSTPTLGTVQITGDQLTYRPFADVSGIEHLKYVANDGTTDSAAGSIDITITAQNDIPVADALSVTVAEDSTKTLRLHAVDKEQTNLEYRVVLYPQHGTLSGTAPDLIYTPDANYNGSDSFTYVANDGTADSSAATVTLTVTAVNDRPTVNDMALSTAEESALSLTLQGSDADGDNLSYTIVTQPQHGTLSGTAPDLTYTPHANYNGSDSFSYKASDGKLDSLNGTVRISVGAVNDAPTADAKTVVTDEDSVTTITLSGSDADGDSLSYIVVSQPQHGSLSGTAPDLTYTPNADYSGSDSFTYKTNDGSVDSTIATVTITVNSVNDAPIAYAGTYATTEDHNITMLLSGEDKEGSPLTYRIVNIPQHGILSGTAPALTYTPHANYNGSDSFTYIVNDGALDSVPVTVTINITSVNDAPTADAKTVAIDEDSVTTITLSGSDADGDSLSYIVVSQPQHGSLSGTAPALTYTPDADYSGSDSFTYKTNDGSVDSALATVSITVNPLNDAPIIIPQGTVTLDEESSATITLLASDVDGDPLTYQIDQNPSHGTLSAIDANGKLTYTPYSGYHGSDSFSYHVSDATVRSASQSIDIVVQSVNDVPIADAGADITAVEGNVVTLDASASRDDGSIVSYEWKENGASLGTGVSLHKRDWSIGTHTVVLTVTDNDGATATDSVVVTITPAKSITFVKRTLLTGMHKPEAVFCIDLDGDNFKDILTADSGTGDNRWLKNEPNVLNGILDLPDRIFDFTKSPIRDNNQWTESIHAADIDSDGYIDVLPGSYGRGNTPKLAWYENDGNADFSGVHEINATVDDAAFVRAADIDNDGDMDLLTATWGSGNHKGAIAWYENDGSENFTEHIVTSGRTHIAAVLPKDMDGDGDIDLVAAMYGDGKVVWYENDGSENFTEHPLDGTSSNVYAIAIADFNGDGKWDIVSAPDGNGKSYWYRNNGDKTFSTQTLPLDTTASDYGDIEHGDFDNDGDEDILYVAYGAGELGWFRNDGSGNFSREVIATGLTNPSTPDVADLDNDGDLDFAIALYGDKEFAWYENSN